MNLKAKQLLHRIAVFGMSTALLLILLGYKEEWYTATVLVVVFVVNWLADMWVKDMLKI